MTGLNRRSRFSNPKSVDINIGFGIYAYVNINSNIFIEGIITDKLDDSIIVVSLSDIIAPKLMDLDQVKEKAQELLLSEKTNQKLLLLSAELEEANKEDNIKNFIEPYSFISEESFVDIKRYSSLLPQEVTSKIFDASIGNFIKVNSRTGDIYHINV